MTVSWNLDDPPVPEDSVRVRLVFVRHGESEWNAQGRIQGHRGGGLTTRGREQARAAAAYLCRAHPRPPLIVSSDLARAVQTAEAYAETVTPDTGLRLDRRLREVDNGAWAGRLAVEVAASEAEYVARIRHGEDLPRGAGGESLAGAQARVGEFCDDLAAELAGCADPARRWAVVFGHGGTIRLAALAALGLAGTTVQRLGHAANTAITTIDHWVDAGGAVVATRLVEYNSAPHLAVDPEQSRRRVTLLRDDAC